ncbi:MAG: endopeptidase La [SAR324 cluster bacterium]|nr:endopeptidase La [SAR324 cluster bacterium]
MVAKKRSANLPRKPRDKRENILLIDSDGNVITLAELPAKIPILPLYHRPMFPGILTMVGSSMAASEWIQSTLNKTNNIVGLLLLDPDKHEGSSELGNIESTDDFYQMGTVAYVLNWVELPDHSCQFMLSTLKRFVVEKMTKRKGNFMADVRYLEETEPEMTEEIKACGAAIISGIKEIIPHNPIFSQEMNYLLSQVDINDPGMLTDLAASVTNAKSIDLQEILETPDLSTRMEKTLLLLREEYDLSLLKEKINQKIEEKISKHQREFFLREQLKAIKVELGLEQDRKQVELTRFRKKIGELELSEEAKVRVHQEMERYEILDEHSPEIHVIFQYLEWLSSLPWGIYSKDRLSLSYAQKVLNEDHDGLKDVKKRILEFIGVSKLKGGVSGSIVCLVGPPGVGKTSLGKSIARALGRKFYHFSLGGMHDESELKGHRRTYVGALPGRLIHALRDVKTSNPVIMLDELDKVGNSYRGDPYSVLLEVLDPEQNQEFLDHYLDVRFDLSNVLFIATANILDPIHPALLDRMEIIRLSGYILEEKERIAQRHLLPKLIPGCGLTPENVSFEQGAIKKVILEYAREAGVRNLEKQLNAILRAVATRHARGHKKGVTIKASNVESYLGKPIFTEETYHKQPIPGVVRGLAWTPLGGSVLYIESCILLNNKKTLKLTGQLGNVMRESSSIAHTYIQSILKKINKKDHFLKKHAVHLHVPAGATPKDGPSAGIAMATSLLSLALNQPIPADLAMTGELTLTGYVLPIGGVKEKTIGARLAGIKTLIFPKENEKDYEELPPYLKKGLTIHLVSHFHEVIKIALGLELK